MNVVDLFCGIGGVAHGFHQVGGFKTLFANDVDGDMCKSFKTNMPQVNVICDSIANVNFLDLIGKEKVDLVVGGPPCQAYSTSGKRLLEDPRAMLYQQYYRALKESQPQMFVYENVKGLLSMSGGRLFEEVQRLFASLGYFVEAKILKAADYGIPQERERVIVVGVRDGIKFSYPEPTHQPANVLESDLFFKSALKPYITLGEAIGDLPFISSGQQGFSYSSKPQNDYQKLMRFNAPMVLMDHDAPNHGESLLQVIRHVPEGGIKKDIPEKYRPKSGFPNSYGRLWWDKPSTTMTRNLGTPSSARCIHPKCDRALTTREGARIQSFPDNFVFYGSRSKKNLQIGNAVPPLLAAAIARQVKKALS
jgi:DNA (cytosine-5)-methyltransferase 1